MKAVNQVMMDPQSPARTSVQKHKSSDVSPLKFEELKIKQLRSQYKNQYREFQREQREAILQISKQEAKVKRNPVVLKPKQLPL